MNIANYESFSDTRNNQLNHSTEIPHSLSNNFNNMDIILESDILEDRTDRYDTPDSSIQQKKKRSFADGSG